MESDLAWAPTHTLTNPFTEVVDHSAATSILAAGVGPSPFYSSPQPALSNPEGMRVLTGAAGQPIPRDSRASVRNIGVVGVTQAFGKVGQHFDTDLRRGPKHCIRTSGRPS